MAWFIGFVCGLVVLATFASDWPATALRHASCIATCGKAEAYTSSPAMCVCRDGSTHRGKAPEFYR